MELKLRSESAHEHATNLLLSHSQNLICRHYKVARRIKGRGEERLLAPLNPTVPQPKMAVAAFTAPDGRD